MGCQRHFLGDDEPVLMTKPKPLLSQLSIHHRLESCEWSRAEAEAGQAFMLLLLRVAINEMHTRNMTWMKSGGGAGNVNKPF